MTKIRALTPHEAKKSLAQRLGKVADRGRQIAVRLGAAPYRVFLTWTRWTGEEPGEGEEVVVRRVEILPTPRVRSLDNVAFSAFAAGEVPEGSLKVDGVSVHKFTRDILRGVMEPVLHADQITPRFSFFYEVVEDGRADPCPVREKFRLASEPFLNATSATWSFMLERESQDRTRDDRSSIGEGTQG